MTGEEKRPVTGLSDEYFAELVAPAPDFSPEQLEQLRRILGGPIDQLGVVRMPAPAPRAAA